MVIDRVTITGADDNTKGSDLLALQEQYPFVEWGILFSKSKTGTARYPSEQWLIENLSPNLNLSAHYCGWHSKEVIKNANLQLLDNIVGNFNRVQLNFNFNSCLSPRIEEIIGYARLHPKFGIIFQYNKSNVPILNYLIKNYTLPENIHFLYDSSGGRGTVISKIEQPFKNYTGYSGGINPENIEEITKLIRLEPNPNPINGDFIEKVKRVWIDMESGVRTNDVLDLGKVNDILFHIDETTMHR